MVGAEVGLSLGKTHSHTNNDGADEVDGVDDRFLLGKKDGCWVVLGLSVCETSRTS